MKMAAMLRQDIRFQFRSGMYGAALFIVFIYVTILQFLPEEYRKPAAAFFIVSDTGALGAVFAGAAVLMERTGGILRPLLSSALDRRLYALSKVLSLGGVSALAGVVLYFASGVDSADWIFPISGILFTSVFFTALGVWIALGSSGINSYFFRSILFVVPLFLPVIGVAGFMKSQLFLLLPVGATLELLFPGESPGPYFAIVSQLFWIAGTGMILSRKILGMVPGETKRRSGQ